MALRLHKDRSQKESPIQNHKRGDIFMPVLARFYGSGRLKGKPTLRQAQTEFDVMKRQLSKAHAESSGRGRSIHFCRDCVNAYCRGAFGLRYSRAAGGKVDRTEI